MVWIHMGLHLNAMDFQGFFSNLVSFLVLSDVLRCSPLCFCSVTFLALVRSSDRLTEHLIYRR